MDIRTGEVLSSSKVNQFDFELVIEQDVLRLEVTMHDLILIMQGIDSLDDMGSEVLKNRLSNDTVELRMVPKLAIGWAFHL